MIRVINMCRCIYIDQYARPHSLTHARTHALTQSTTHTDAWHLPTAVWLVVTYRLVERKRPSENVKRNLYYKKIRHMYSVIAWVNLICFQHITGILTRVVCQQGISLTR